MRTTRWAPALYPTGAVSMSYNFTEPGRYIGLDTAPRPGGGQIFLSVFPFSIVVANLLFAAGLYFFSARDRRKAAKI